MVGCLWILGALIMPRLLLFVLWIIGFFENADPWNTWIWPLLGFFFMPVTTLTFGLAHVYNGGDFSFWWIVGMILAVLYDLGSGGSAGAKGRSR